MTTINNTKVFLEKMAELLEEEEEEILTEEYSWKTFLDILILKYGKFELKYSLEESLIMAAIVMERGIFKKGEKKETFYTIDEYLNLFSFLFERKGVTLSNVKKEHLLRVKIFLEENKRV